MWFSEMFEQLCNISRKLNYLLFEDVNKSLKQSSKSYPLVPQAQIDSFAGFLAKWLVKMRLYNTV